MAVDLVLCNALRIIEESSPEALLLCLPQLLDTNLVIANALLASNNQGGKDKLSASLVETHPITDLTTAQPTSKSASTDTVDLKTCLQKQDSVLCI